MAFDTLTARRLTFEPSTTPYRALGLARTPGRGPEALVQLDPSPVTDKNPTGGVPEQGFEGEAVEHKDMETVTGDWGKEYGGKKKVRGRVL